jgi:hypothetical protein
MPEWSLKWRNIAITLGDWHNLLSYKKLNYRRSLSAPKTPFRGRPGRRFRILPSE